MGQHLAGSTPAMRFHALVAFVLATTVTATTAAVVQSHRHKLHDSTKNHLLTGYNPSRLVGPCSKVECPPLEKEVQLTTLGAALRKYKPAKWLTVEDDNWKFKHVNCIDFKEAFMKIIGYQRGNNFAGSPIPITTPIVVELFIDDKFDEFDPDRKVSFRSGFKVYWRLDSSVASDPYAEPTVRDLNIVGWTPTDEDEWVAVHQWTQEDTDDSAALKVQYNYFKQNLVAALAEHGSAYLGSKAYLAIWGGPIDRFYELWIPDIDEKDVILQHATAFRRQLTDAFDSVGGVKPAIRRLYYAAWGGPVDRVHELWVPVSGDSLLTGVAAEQSLRPSN